MKFMSLILALAFALSISAKEATSDNGKYSFTIPEAWTVRTKFDDPSVPLAVLAPKLPDATFRENVVIILQAKGKDVTLKSVAAEQDETAKKRRPDFVVSEEKSVKIGDRKAISRICTMTFPEFVSKNRQYIVDAGDKFAIVTCSVPEPRFKEIDETIVKICESFRVDPEKK